MWMRRLMLLLALTFGWTVAYSRIVLGMHSYNQIFYGLALGAWLALSFHYICYDGLMSHLAGLCNNKVFNCVRDQRKKKFVSLTGICFSLFALLMAI
jgi:membrane-associated phospholipid phosphatase